MRALLLCLLSLSLCGCGVVYRLPTRQGNVYDQTDLKKINVGMTRDQVRFVLGTPIATNPFRSERWDYVGYYKSPRGQITSRTVSLYFDKDTLTRVEGVEQPGDKTAVATPDTKTLIKQDKQDRAEAERAEEPPPSGVTIGPDNEPANPTPKPSNPAEPAT